MDCWERKFVQNVVSIDMVISKEKLKYLLNMVYPSIEMFVEQVLDDSKVDPEYSAVAAANVIKCYVQIMEEIGEKRPYNNIEEFFAFNGYTKDEYQLFEESRKNEAQYYNGVQY